MIKIIILFFVFSLALISCGEKKPEIVVKKDSVEMIVKEDTTLIVYKEHETRSGKKFIIVESKPTESVSNYYVTGSGFNNSNDTLAFPLKNPLHNSLLADIDNDGFQELYIITKSTGSESFLNIFGIASEGDTSLVEIKAHQTTSEEFQNNENMAGYLGNDSIYFTGKNIIREFPVYKSSDLAADNTKGKRRITYVLKKGDEFYELDISDVKDIK